MASVVQQSEEPFLENRTFGAQHGASDQTDGYLSNIFAGQSSLSIAITILLILVAYDQSMPSRNARSCVRFFSDACLQLCISGEKVR